MLTNDQRRARIETIRSFPSDLAKLVNGLSREQLTTHYVEGEWSVQRIVHHTADSHMNAFIRLKLILTAHEPTLVGYDQDKWSTLPDVELPIQVSLQLLDALHRRWCVIWDSVQDSEWAKTGNHTENGRVSIEDMLITYDKHCTDHLDQLRRVLAAAKA